MAKNLGLIDTANNDLPGLASGLGILAGTYIGTGILESIPNSASSDVIDYYSFQFNGTAPINSYIELNSPDVVNIKAHYAMTLYRYDAQSDKYVEVADNYQLPNSPYTYRIDLAGLAAGKYVVGVTGAKWSFASSATGLYELRVSVPSPTQPGTVINGNDSANSLLGTNDENTINAKGGNDTINGGAGDDTIYGGNGNDNLTGGLNSDVLDGGSGLDKVIESGNLAKFILGNNSLVGNGVDVLLNIEQAVLTGGDTWNLLDASAFTLGSVTLVGGGSDDTLLGGAGADSLQGDDGFDILNGGAGADKLVGGTGGDLYIVDNTGDIVVETSTFGYDQVESSVSYTLGKTLEALKLTGSAAINGAGNSQDNYLTGNSAANSLSGLDGDDVLDGGQGIDTLVGGNGDDTYYVDTPGDIVVEEASAGLDVVNSSAKTYTLGDNIEQLAIIGNGLDGTGNSLKNTLSGNGLGNKLYGGRGEDILYGSYGDDTLKGGISDDFLYGGGDNDILMGETAKDYLDGQGGNDKLNGGPGQDSYSDWSGANTYIFQFKESLLSAPDIIDGFSVGEDKIDLLSVSGGALAKPVAFTRAADQDFSPSLASINQVFADANGKLAGNQPLGLNSAAVVDIGGYYNAYVVVNDNTPGFQADTDLVFKMATFGDLPPVGVVGVDLFFA
ncbi:calcium-binding protein [Methylomagnum ishizawai]|uniref:calcium-binding protein n=1 Tax=Methylomagnum ishizawai TaxID=1760988 RepID=UPI001C331E10|nr:calcium-binding protein [Methylomagnum ishizawai]BBL76190.1 hypothetical protein MishRS11D_32880 [Methylomagnum ishizawai]